MKISTYALEWYVWYLKKRDRVYSWLREVWRYIHVYWWHYWYRAADQWWMLVDPVTTTRMIETHVVNKRTYWLQMWTMRGMAILLVLSGFIHLSNAVLPPIIVKDDYAVGENHRAQLRDARAALELETLMATTQTARAAKYREALGALQTHSQRLEAEIDRLRHAAIARRIRAVNASVDANALARRFLEASEAHGVPVDILLRIGQIESGYRLDAVSHAGARGVMQIMPFWKSRCPDWAGEGNIHCGARILAYECRRAKSWKECLAGYNGSDSEASAQRYFVKVTGGGEQ